MMALYKKYEGTKAIATFPMSNFGGLEILDLIDVNGHFGVVACFNWGTGRQKIRRYKIQTAPSGREFIRKDGIRFYFDTMMGA